MSEFSRRIDVLIIKDEPFTRDEYFTMRRGEDVSDIAAAYARYLEQHQPYRWVARSHGNSLIIAWGESYFNEADCRDNIALNYGDNTTAYVMPMFGEYRGEVLLRYGATDRASQAATE